MFAALTHLAPPPAVGSMRNIVGTKAWSMTESDDESGHRNGQEPCDAYQLIRDLNLVLVGIVASYILEVMWSSEDAAPLRVLEGPGSPHFLSALGTSVAIVGSVVLIPKFWERYFQLLRDCKSCKLSLEVVYSFAALLLPVAALLIVASPPVTAGQPEWGSTLGLRIHYFAVA